MTIPGIKPTYAELEAEIERLTAQVDLYRVKHAELEAEMDLQSKAISDVFRFFEKHGIDVGDEEYSAALFTGLQFLEKRLTPSRPSEADMERLRRNADAYYEMIEEGIEHAEEMQRINRLRSEAASPVAVNPAEDRFYEAVEAGEVRT